MTVFLLVVIAIEAYVIGGINGSIIVSKYLYHKDVRNYGSGNAGLTNFYRVFGPFGVAMVLALDVIKSVVAILAGRLLLSIVGAPTVGVVFSGFCLMLGHVYPVFYGFKGGKGVLCGCVVTFMVKWWIGVVCLLVFFIVVLLTRYVSLGSMLGAGMFAPLVWIAGLGGLEGLLALFCVLLLVFEHRSNIRRLISHTESRFDFKHPERKIEKDNF